MDDRIQELLERARETAATAGEYAGQMVDTARLRGRLFALRTDINGLLHTAGRLVYDAHRGGAGGEDALEQVFSELDRKGGRGVKYHVILAAAALAANRQTVFRARPGRLLQIRRTSFMNYTFAQYQESADYIRSQIGALRHMGDIVEKPH